MSTIMVVDNDASTVETIRIALKVEGYDVIVAYGGRQCLERLKETPVDLIILDVMMPEVDGIQVCTKIAEDKKLKDIPIILISALPIESDTFQKTKERLPSFKNIKAEIEKPFDMYDFVKRVKRILPPKRKELQE